MSTYLELQTRIADELLDNGQISTAQIKKAILSSIQYYERRDFWWNERYIFFPTVINQEEYGSLDNASIPNLLRIRWAQIETGPVSWIPMIGVTPEEISAVQDYSASGYGQPMNYAIFEEKIQLYPIPSAVYSVVFGGSFKYTALSADADTNAWTTDAEELIRQSSKRRLALDILHSEDIANRCGMLEKESYDQIMAEGRLRNPDTILRTADVARMTRRTADFNWRN